MKRKELRWNEPPPRALDWVRLCIESSKASVVRLEREAFERARERWGAEEARRMWRDECRAGRKTSLLITLTLQLSTEEQEALSSWWGEWPAEDAEPALPPAPPAPPAEKGSEP